MVWALLPLLLLAFIFGFTAIERDLATKAVPAAPSQGSVANAAAQEFMVYRNAVVNYVGQQLVPNQSGKTGGEISPAMLVQYQYLSQAESDALPAGAEAVYVLNNPAESGIYGVATTANAPGFFVCVWMPAPSGTVGLVMDQLFKWYGGDLTLGLVVDNNGNWRQVGAGGKTQLVPSSCISYAAVSGKTPRPTPSVGDVISVVGLGGN